MLFTDRGAAATVPADAVDANNAEKERHTASVAPTMPAPRANLEPRTRPEPDSPTLQDFTASRSASMSSRNAKCSPFMQISLLKYPESVTKLVVECGFRFRTRPGRGSALGASPMPTGTPMAARGVLNLTTPSRTDYFTLNDASHRKQ
ncbi:hypothetical protein [Amycolatopsis sp. lyj-109]|uniref:hypothetical protein n=1 Tax=Amycolatopsis sp. lyj-109 TaxID=2789287 RepID=UPI00397AB024